MPQPPQPSRICASKDGLQKLKNARESKRTDDGKRWSYEYIALKLSEKQVLANQKSPKNNGKHLTIIGEPGAGKTTQLLKIADWVLDETEDLPIWISLGVVGEKPLQEYLLKDWLRDAAGKLDAAPPQWVEQLEQHLKDGRVWLLLDGADEMQVADPLGKLAEFLRVPLLKNVRVVLTCRMNLWDAAGNALSEFDTYKMLDFSYGDGKNSDQVKQFIDKWFGNPSPALPYKEREQEASPRVGGTEGGEQLRKTLEETGKERIKDLARHPLRLALLCFTWQSGRGLPDTKAELYEMFVEALYVLKKGVFPTTSAQQIELNAALGRLALEAIDKRFKSILPFSLVYEELEKPHPELFDLADKLGWLNRVGVEPENHLKPVYAFFHPTFQEYFAACEIPDWDFFLPRDHIDRPVRDKDNPEKYKRYRIFEPQWKEVILLWLGRPEQAVSSEQKENFIDTLVEFQDGCQDFYQYQTYFLAAASIVEFRDYSLADKIVTQVDQWCSEDYFSNPLHYKAEAALTVLRESDSRRVIKAQIQRLLSRSTRLVLEVFEVGDSDVIEALTNLLYTSQDKRMRQYIAENLGTIDPGNPDAIKALVGQLDSSQDENIRCGAAESLLKIDSGNPKAIATLSNLLRTSNNSSICWRSAHLLEEKRVKNIDAIRAFIYWMNNIQNGYDLTIAVSILAKIGLGNLDAVNALVALWSTSHVDNYDWNVGWKIAGSLGEMGTGSLNDIEFVLEQLTISNEQIRAQAATILGGIAFGNSDAITALADLLKTSEDKLIRECAVKSLAKIDPENYTWIAQLIELLRDENAPLIIACGFFIDLNLEKICKSSPTAIKSVIHLLQTCKDEFVLQEATGVLGRIYPTTVEIIDAITKLLDPSYSKWTRRKAAEILRDIAPQQIESISGLTELLESSEYKLTQESTYTKLQQITPHDSKTVTNLLQQLCTSNDESIIRQSTWHLQEIISGNLFTLAVPKLKECLRDQVDKNDYFNHLRYEACYEVLWHYAQHMPYPDFYQAWIGEPSNFHPELDSIPVGNSPEAQILEAQNLDFNQLQPTDYTFPLTINLLSLKGEIDKEEIAQELCIQIYKHPDVDIAGEPPDTFNARQLKKRLFPIKDKLQRPNLALVLYIKDTNGFHEPTEEAIAFCQKLAAPDLGIHIAWITNQSLEQFLKDIQPDPPKLISKIQSWIDEIV